MTAREVGDDEIRAYQDSVVELTGQFPPCTVIALAGPPRKPDRRAQYKIDRDTKRWQDARVACAALIDRSKAGAR